MALLYDLKGMAKITAAATSDERRLHNQKRTFKLNPSTLLITLLIGVSFFAGFLFFKSQSLEKDGGLAQQLNQPSQPTPTNLKIPKPTTSEHWTGSRDAKIILVEYSDLECPFCKSLHPTLIRLLRENQGKVAWVFRHYPQIIEHTKSQKLAEAIECAAEQGGEKGFWNMTDAIYNKMPNLELVELPYIASSVGLSESALKKCLDTNRFESKVDTEQKEAEKVGFRMTPSTVVYNLSNDKTLFVEDDVPYDQFKAKLEAFMK